MIENVPVNSSVIGYIQYDTDKKQMIIGFKKGGNYMYHNVDIFAWNQFKMSDSKGTYYAKNIKGKYIGTKM